MNFKHWLTHQLNLCASLPPPKLTAEVGGNLSNRTTTLRLVQRSTRKINCTHLHYLHSGVRLVIISFNSIKQTRRCLSTVTAGYLNITGHINRANWILRACEREREGGTKVTPSSRLLQLHQLAQITNYKLGWLNFFCNPVIMRYAECKRARTRALRWSKWQGTSHTHRSHRCGNSRRASYRTFHPTPPLSSCCWI